MVALLLSLSIVSEVKLCMIIHAKEGDNKSTIVGGTDGARYGDKVVIMIDWCRLAVDVQQCCSVKGHQVEEGRSLLVSMQQGMRFPNFGSETR